MGRLKESFEIAMVYVGAVIGAGFASGREIVNFFTTYGRDGLAGIKIAWFLFVATGLALVMTCYLFKAYTYQDLLIALSNRRWGTALAKGLTVFLFLTLVVMIAGSATLLADLLNIHLLQGAGLTAIVLAIILAFGLRGLINANVFLVPSLIALVVVLGRSIDTSTTPLALAETPNHSLLAAMVSALLYVCFNTIIIAVVITSLANKYTWRPLCEGVTLGALVIGLLLWQFNTLLSQFLPLVSNSELPLLKIIEHGFYEFYGVYALVLLMAFTTTALANAHGIIEQLQHKLPRWVLATLLPLAAMPLALVGFANLVRVIYPLVGYLSISLLVALHIWPIRRISIMAPRNKN